MRNCHAERSEASLYSLENKYRGPSLRSGRQARIAFFISLLGGAGPFRQQIQTFADHFRRRRSESWIMPRDPIEQFTRRRPTCFAAGVKGGCSRTIKAPRNPRDEDGGF